MVPLQCTAGKHKKTQSTLRRGEKKKRQLSVEIHTSMRTIQQGNVKKGEGLNSKKIFSWATRSLATDGLTEWDRNFTSSSLSDITWNDRCNRDGRNPPGNGGVGGRVGGKFTKKSSTVLWRVPETPSVCEKCLLRTSELLTALMKSTRPQFE